MKFFVYGFIIFWCVQVFTCIWEGYRPGLGKRPWARCYFCCLLNFSIDWKGILVSAQFPYPLNSMRKTLLIVRLTFQPGSKCFEMWQNTFSHVWYIAYYMLFTYLPLVSKWTFIGWLENSANIKIAYSKIQSVEIRLAKVNNSRIWRNFEIKSSDNFGEYP